MIKLNNEKLTQQQFQQIMGLIQNLDSMGYNPSLVSQSETHVTIQHNDDDNNVIKMMLMSKGGELTGVEL
jgi:hypothetical protein